MKIENKIVRSPIRWAGSKRGILKELFLYFPENKEIYIEPFIGSGTVLLNVLKQRNHTSYKQFYANDINTNIIDLFLLIKKDSKYLIKQSNRIFNKYNSLKSLSEKEEFYYLNRKAFNCHQTTERVRPVIFYFLMKSGFNGVYRENLKGEFNVPFGKKEQISNDVNIIRETESLIQDVKFFNESYSDFLEKMKDNNCLNKTAFVYCDPPYIADDMATNQTTKLYTREVFNHEIFIKYLKTKNIDAVISMSQSSKAMEIYDLDPFEMHILKTTTRIVNPKKPFASSEVIFTSLQNNQKIL